MGWWGFFFLSFFLVYSENLIDVGKWSNPLKNSVCFVLLLLIFSDLEVNSKEKLKTKQYNDNIFSFTFPSGFDCVKRELAVTMHNAPSIEDLEKLGMTAFDIKSLSSVLRELFCLVHRSVA
jgi:hypothetical protein